MGVAVQSSIEKGYIETMDKVLIAVFVSIVGYTIVKMSAAGEFAAMALVAGSAAMVLCGGRKIAG